MPGISDMDLAREYVHRNSEEAFAELVERHINLVYSVALRYVRNVHDAQDVTEAVFITLARKAAKLGERSSLTGWLYETTRLTAVYLLRTQARRRAREQEASMQAELNGPDTDTIWWQLRPLLEQAMDRLTAKERELIALRYFENRSAADTAVLFGIREAAAHKRTERAVEKLRVFFGRRGINISAGNLITAVSAHSVQAAPVGLVKPISAVALAKGTVAGGSTLTLVKGALKLMAWTKAKTAVLVGVIVVATTTTSVVGYKLVKSQAVFQSDALTDLQPDGTIRSQVTVEGINHTGMTITSNDFQDAILHIDRITDGSGQPIQFTTRRDGGLWRYTETFNKPIQPGGKIVETLEGTATGLIKPTGEPNVYQYQTDIMLGNGDAHRVEVIRLPPGAILLEKQPAEAEETTNNGRIELRIDKIIPSGGSVAVSCRYRLAANGN